MSLLLPPKVIGPVSVLSPIVSISGAQSGNTVQLLKNGTPIGTPEIADSFGNARISVGGLGLHLNDKLTATQTKAADTSPPSAFPETVVGAPTNVPAPIFLSQLHTCADCVILGGLIPGAVVKVSLGAAELGSSIATGTQETIVISRAGPIAANSVLIAVQEVTFGGTTNRSPETPSLPVVTTFNRELMLQPPMIVLPVSECDPYVTVTGVRDGAFMDIKTDRPTENQYLFYGNTVRFSVEPLKLGEEVTAKQQFRACGFDSNPSMPVKATKLASLPSTKILPVICPGTRQVVITDLVPGADVAIYAERNGSATLLGMATANASTQTFDIPVIPSWLDGPALFLQSWQDRCDVGSLVTLKTPIEALPNVPGAPGLPSMFACGRVVEVFNVVAGLTVQLTSDQADWPVLSAPTQALGTKLTLLLYRPLREGEIVTVTATGCGAGPGAKSSDTVHGLPDLSLLKISEPVRTWMTKVTVTGCVPGAQVHVFVNDAWRGRAEASSGLVEVVVGDLNKEDKVTALQAMCSKIGHTSPAANVTPGKMNVRLQPSPATRGPAAQSVTVHVEDADDRHAVPATVNVGGSNFPANSPFNWVFPAGSANPAVKVSATDYNTENTSWPLVDPPPVVTTASLTLQLLADSPVVVKSVSWEVLKQEVPPASPSHVTNASGSTTSVNLPKPAGGQILYYVTCSVNFDLDGGNYTATWVQHTVSTYPGSAMIGWSGSPMTAKFALQTALVANEYGGYDFQYWVYFWGVV